VPADLRLTEEQMVTAILDAPATRPDRYTILEHLSLSRDETRNKIKEYVDAVTELGG
jgi:glycerol-1-phosphate dehydrogenase [NAD(P)+]